MESKPYLIFSLHGLSYAIDARQVREIFLLPELTPIEEAPEDIVGILNLRSKIVPIMHLDLRFEHPFQSCSVDDSVIVVESQELLIGVIVHQVDEIKYIDSSAIETDVSYGRVKDINSAFVSGVSKIDNDLIILLDLENLLRYPQTVKNLINEAEEQLITTELKTEEAKNIKQESLAKDRGLEPRKIISSFYDFCCPKATPKEREVFKQRTNNLRESIEISEHQGLVKLAVVGIGEEYFGLDLQIIREFTEINHFTPIPCCPSQIIGNINWQGEIVTLIDICNALNLGQKTFTQKDKAVVIQIDDIIVGFPVEEILDVMDLSSTQIKSLPIAAEENYHQYLQGVADYYDKTLSILDLKKMLAAEIFTVSN